MAFPPKKSWEQRLKEAEEEPLRIGMILMPPKLYEDFKRLGRMERDYRELTEKLTRLFEENPAWGEISTVELDEESAGILRDNLFELYVTDEED